MVEGVTQTDIITQPPHLSPRFALSPFPKSRMQWLILLDSDYKLDIF